jgi:hypothetical protein
VGTGKLKNLRRPNGPADMLVDASSEDITRFQMGAQIISLSSGSNNFAAVTGNIFIQIIIKPQHLGLFMCGQMKENLEQSVYLGMINWFKLQLVQPIVEVI